VKFLSPLVCAFDQAGLPCLVNDCDAPATSRPATTAHGLIDYYRQLLTSKLLNIATAPDSSMTGLLLAATTTTSTHYVHWRWV
jgi:hypothetical protein